MTTTLTVTQAAADDANAHEIHEFMRGADNPEWRCSPTVPYLQENRIKEFLTEVTPDTYTILKFYEDAVMVGVAIIRDTNGLVLWLSALPNYYLQVANDLGNWTIENHPTLNHVWGYVLNDRLRKIFDASVETNYGNAVQGVVDNSNIVWFDPNAETAFEAPEDKAERLARMRSHSNP